MLDKEMVNLTTVIGVSKHDYLLDDGTILIKDNGVPDLKAGDRIEISTDGKSVVWNFLIN